MNFKLAQVNVIDSVPGCLVDTLFGLMVDRFNIVDMPDWTIVGSSNHTIYFAFLLFMLLVVIYFFHCVKIYFFVLFMLEWSIIATKKKKQKKYF